MAGYADTEGIKHADHFRPQAWRYRDYVIRSLNRDKPYDRFLVEQLAGDECVADYKKEVHAGVWSSWRPLGFLRLASDPTDSPSNASLAEKPPPLTTRRIQTCSTGMLSMLHPWFALLPIGASYPVPQYAPSLAIPKKLPTSP